MTFLVSNVCLVMALTMVYTSSMLNNLAQMDLPKLSSLVRSLLAMTLLAWFLVTTSSMEQASASCYVNLCAQLKRIRKQLFLVIG